MKQQPPISVCIPSYNASAFIQECIDSVLSQTFTNFELIIVDDGSTDNTCELIEEYSDSRIRLVRKEHDFIGTQIRLFDEAKGKYIALLDHDDRMLPDRLQTQYDFMESHPHVDAMGGGMLSFGDYNGTTIPRLTDRALTLDDLSRGNVIANPTIIVRKESLDRCNLRPNSKYPFAHDYYFWVRAVLAGLHIENTNRILTEYRISSGQFSSVHNGRQSQEAEAIQQEILDIIAGEYKEGVTDLSTLSVPNTGNKLTLIIPFLNEKEEVRNTVASAREFAGDRVDIIVINDHSTDGYDYRSELQPYRVTYIYNGERLGVAASRDLGVRLCTTPYFLLLDAHMRFYEAEWPERIIRLLDTDDRCLLCAQSKVLHKENGELQAPKKTPSFGAFHPFAKDHFIPDIEWNNRDFFPDRTVVPIAAVLGAGYAASVRYWTYLRGLEGLLHYGSDEAYISLKVRLEGGQCLLMKDVVIGHIYRTSAPYRNLNEKVLYNHLLIACLLFPLPLRSLSFAIAQKKNPFSFEKALGLLRQNRKQINNLKAYYRSIFTIPFEQVIDWHRILPEEKEKAIRTREADSLPLIAEWLEGHIPSDDWGLWYGKTGYMVWLSLYSAYSGETKWDDLASQLWEEVYKHMEQKRLPVNFCYGLCGIGWALLYLKAQGLLEDDIDEELKLVDQTVGEQRLDSYTDHSLATGTTGILCYAATRLRHAITTGEKDVFTPATIEALQNCARNTLNQQDDIYALNFARQILALTEEDSCEDTVPAFNEWMNYPPFLTEDRRFWEPGLTDGITGYGLLILSTLNHLKNSPYHEND